MKSIKKQVNDRVVKEVIRQERNYIKDHQDLEVIWLVRNQLTDMTWEQIWDRVRVLVLFHVTNDKEIK